MPYIKKRIRSRERALAAQNKITLTGVDVAAIARVQPATAYAALAAGMLTGQTRSGRWYRVTHDQVIKWIAAGCPTGETKP